MTEEPKQTKEPKQEEFEEEIEEGEIGLALQAELQEEYVLGFPVHIALTLRSRDKGAAFHYLPIIDFFSLPSELGIELLDQRGRTVTEVEPVVNSMRFDKRQGFHLVGCEARRILIDLSPLIPVNLTPDTYQLRIDLAIPVVISTEPLAIRLRSPDELERALLDFYEPLVDEAGSWSDWTLEPTSPDELDKAIRSDDPLRFNKVLRSLLCDPTAWSELDLRMLNVLDGIYEADAQVLRAILLQARGGVEEVRAIEEEATAKFSGLEWLFAELWAGESGLAGLRRLSQIA